MLRILSQSRGLGADWEPLYEPANKNEPGAPTSLHDLFVWDAERAPRWQYAATLTSPRLTLQAASMLVDDRRQTTFFFGSPLGSPWWVYVRERWGDGTGRESGRTGMATGRTNPRVFTPGRRGDYGTTVMDTWPAAVLVDVWTTSMGQSWSWQGGVQRGLVDAFGRETVNMAPFWAYFFTQDAVAYFNARDGLPTTQALAERGGGAVDRVLTRATV